MRTTDDLDLSFLSHANCSLSPNITNRVDSTTDIDNVDNTSYFILWKPSSCLSPSHGEGYKNELFMIPQSRHYYGFSRYGPSPVKFGDGVDTLTLLYYTVQHIKMAKKKKTILRKGTIGNSPTFMVPASSNHHKLQALMTSWPKRDGHLKHQAPVVSSSSHGICKCSRHEQCKLKMETFFRLIDV